MNNQKIIGIDFDNTIVCYDEVFYKIALEKYLIPDYIAKNKESVRNYLRQIGQENHWTELQGYVYGMRMREASIFPGVIEFIKAALEREHVVYIISHKTVHPYMGPKYDLHKAAQDWLEFNGFFDPNQIGLAPQNVFFEISLENKLKRIEQMQCTHFIDDLPEVLTHEKFPAGANRILFAPQNQPENLYRLNIFKSWQEINKNLIGLQHECA